MTLYDEHIKDLHRSGLSDPTIEMMECYSLAPGEVLALPDVIGLRIKSALVFPYFAHGTKNNFVRVKLFPEYQGPRGVQKYWQAPGSKAHLYILPTVEKILSDPSVPLFIVEGEKKAARVIEAGAMAIGLGGLWNWKEKNVVRAIDEFDWITWDGRDVIIVPDSDVWTTEYDSCRLAMYMLGQELKHRNAEVTFKILRNADAKNGS